MGDAWKNNASSKAWTRKLFKQTVRPASTDQIAADHVQSVKLEILMRNCSIAEVLPGTDPDCIFPGGQLPGINIMNNLKSIDTCKKSLQRFLFVRFVGVLHKVEPFQPIWLKGVGNARNAKIPMNCRLGFCWFNFNKILVLPWVSGWNLSQMRGI